MAKFCGKCGSELDETTGLCPNCNKEQLSTSNTAVDDEKTLQHSSDKGKNTEEVQVSAVEDNGNGYDSKSAESTESREAPLSKKEIKKQRKKDKKEAKKAKKREKRATWSTGKKIRHFILKMILSVFLIIVIVACIVGGLVYTGVVDIPMASGVVDELDSYIHPADVAKNIPDTDMSGITYYESSEENIISEDGVTFINNEILVGLKSESYKQDLEKNLLGIDAKIVGELSEIAEYQILLNKEYSYQQLSDIINEMKTLDWVMYASINYATKFDVSYTPNDSKWKNEWGDIPEGNNWGMETIECPNAWERNSEFKSVNIGIFDLMFDVNHEDLNFVEQPLGNIAANKAVSDGKIKWSSHGTHTAGTVAATYDNRTGVAGISSKTNLYGVSSRGLEINGYYSSQAWNMAFVYLISNKKCSVINISLGYDDLTFNASRGCNAAIKTLDEVSTSIADFLQVLIDKDYQFVICKSAGNQNEVGGDYKYYLKDSYDENEEFMYYSKADYDNYRNGKADEECKQYFDRHKKDLKKRISDGGCLDDGNVDAKYDLLGAITNQKVKDRIIIVGAVENLGVHYEGGFLWFGRTKVHDGYKIADFSQCGERVDVLAPGVDIQSTVRNGYGTMSGTSMASPHVTGIVGLAFSANPEMTGSDAKKIVKETAVGSYGKELYGIANAINVVNASFDYIPKDNDEETNTKPKEYNAPNDAVTFNGHYYYLYSGGIASSYDEAAQYCEGKGGYLATLTSKEENDFVYSYITQQGCESAYFGLSDAERAGSWEWINGEPFSYSNWHSGEPNSESSNEDYALLYYKFTDGTWNDGDFGDSTVGGGNAFICEWGDYSIEQHEVSGERNVVLTLDVSGSMSGTPLEETKKASSKFINTVLEQDASIGVVTYDDESYMASDFSTDKASLQSIVSGLYDGGGTNIEAGLRNAQSMLERTNAKKKIIVLMSDGEPNDGLVDEELIEYAAEIKKTGTIIYTIGFFESLSEKSYAQYLMEQIASDGCHYEVADADQLSFFFEDMADQINGQKYIYVRIASPVDVSVSYDGETLDSSEKNLNARTSFGTLTFEENSEKLEAGIDDRVKVLRLKEGTDYDLKIVGTGHGIMNYSIGFMDENGEYSDLRKFKNIKITRKTRIDTEASNSDSSILNIDEDGDGKYDIRLKAEANGYGEEITTSNWIIYVIIGAVAFVMLDIIAIVIYTKKKKRRGE